MSNSKVHLGIIKDLLALKVTEANMLRDNGTIPLTVNFDNGMSALLDMSHPRAAVWANMISRLQRNNQPTYIEIDADTDMITRLCIPIATKVIAIRTNAEGTVEVALSASDALYFLHSDAPDFDKLHHAIQQAKDTGTTILVTATFHNFDIVDVRALPQFVASQGPFGPLPDPEPIVPVSQERCMELFNMVSAETCVTGSMKSPCIAYKYPYSGCNVRAHLMCYMMRAAGATPEKMWISPGLRAKTSNAPQCMVGWGWHVAPTLLVIQPGGALEKMVLDPSLCDGPVTVAYWKSLQGNPNATLTPAQWEGYNFLAKGTATQQEADDEMENYREWLTDLWRESPPPYKCPQ
ncbi:MAG: protein-glutamine glutaminase family protein [Flavipsychrobacter sp.]|nr:protein-glutamine glutaminase family protein [Flavipsychrobacter sp.]